MKQKENRELTLIRITTQTKERIRALADKKEIKQITALEYLLTGKININEL